jgi:hypothetical protein
MHLLSLVSSLFSQQKNEQAHVAPNQAAACLAGLDEGADVKRRLAEMGMKLRIAPLAVRRDRARGILWAMWAQRFARGDESRSFGAFVRGES